MQSKVCGVYQISIVNKKIQAKHIQDLPLESCHGVFGFSTRAIPDVLQWADDAHEYVERKCK